MKWSDKVVENGHWVLGSVNKGDLTADRPLRVKDILLCPAVVLCVQDTAPFDGNGFSFAYVCGVGGFSDGGDADVLA